MNKGNSFLDVLVILTIIAVIAILVILPVRAVIQRVNEREATETARAAEVTKGVAAGRIVGLSQNQASKVWRVEFAQDLNPGIVYLSMPDSNTTLISSSRAAFEFNGTVKIHYESKSTGYTLISIDGY